MFDGRNALAMQAANQLVEEIPAELLAEWPDFVEAFVPTPLHVQVRFGKWREILAVPQYPEEQPFSRAIRYYARTLAYASTGAVDKARVELEQLGTAAAAVPESRLLFNNSCRDILAVATAMAQGEVAYRLGDQERAFAFLRKAVELDDALNYDEPWGWMQPARHALGALLLEEGIAAEAEQVYRADLKRHPKNGWALHGLAEALRLQGQAAEASSCETQLVDAWKRSDIELKASCFCRTGAVAKKE
jgi:tetratricopeptide (TPR) repeat protein